MRSTWPRTCSFAVRSHSRCLRRSSPGDERGLQHFRALALSRLRAESSQHSYHLRIRPGGWPAFHRLRICRRHHPSQKMAGGKIALETAINICIQIVSALAAAHARGIVHRDIKPENVIIRSDGIVKILDFGIAKLTRRRIGSATRGTLSAVAVLTSEPGIVLGTAKYMSPEQARGLIVNARSDIFSLGSVMYELFTGRAAFDGETASDVIAEILKVEPKPPAEFAPEVPAEIERIIGKALRKDRDARYQSAVDLLQDLQDSGKRRSSRPSCKARPAVNWPRSYRTASRLHAVRRLPQVILRCFATGVSGPLRSC